MLPNPQKSTLIRRPQKHKSPLLIAHKLLQDKIKIRTIINKIKQGPISSLPIYNIQKIPANYSVNLKSVKQSEINQNTSTKFFVDGSCVPNPGKGAYGWYTPKYNNLNLHQTLHIITQ